MLKTGLNRMFQSALTLGATVGIGALLAGTGSALAQAAGDKPADKPKGWESVASLGLTLTRGNSEAFMGTVGVNTARKWAQDEALAGANAGYGKNKDQNTGVDNTTDEYIRGFGQWNHLFSQKLYGGLRLDGLYDKVAGVDYRFILSPMVGYYFIKEPRTFLAAEAGPSFIAENLKDKPADQYMGLRLAERFEHKISDTAKVWETAEYIPQVDDFNNYLLNLEIGFSAAINKALDLRVMLQDTFKNQPAPHRKQNDMKLIVGVGYRF
jgi:putative salt-induced outer membrane protein YdiY